MTRKCKCGYLIELLPAAQCKDIAAHKAHMKTLDDWMANIEKDLIK